MSNPLPKYLADQGYKLKVHHLHSHSDPLFARRYKILKENLKHNVWSREYVTVARLVDKAGNDVLHTVAICAPNDQPNRKRGYQIAVGRLLAKIEKHTVA